MPHLLHAHWLWLFGALSLGIVIGWLFYLVAVVRWIGRPTHVAIGAVVIGALLAIAEAVPARYGYRLDLGLSLAAVGAAGAFVGWALRDLADFMPPATRPGGSGSPAVTGSYLFREAFAGMGAGPAYMRATAHLAAPARVRVALPADARANAPERAPAPGGYTFPQTLPFADAPMPRRSGPPTGMRRHWTWPARPAAHDTAPSSEASRADRGEHDDQSDA